MDAAALRRTHNAEPPWQKNLTDYNEGLGVVYERIVLNQYLLDLQRKYALDTVLEAPLYGMAGVSGINSVPLAQAGCRVTLMDSVPERLAGVKRIWGELGLADRATFVGPSDFSRLPFDDGTFDLVWAWAALWYVPDAPQLIREMARVSRGLVFLAMPNRMQIGYILRKFVLEPNFFKTVDESGRISPVSPGLLRAAGLSIAGQGVMDVPPWPDTVMPAALVLRKLGIRSKGHDPALRGLRLAVEHDGLLSRQAAGAQSGYGTLHVSGAAAAALAAQDDMGPPSLRAGAESGRPTAARRNAVCPSLLSRGAAVPSAWLSDMAAPGILIFCLLAFGLPLILYLATLAPSLLNDDPAEYQTLLPVLGVAHPTGYPLYTLLGHLFTRMAPVGDMALRVNLFSAVSGAAAIAVCYLLLRALSVSRLAALPGALALAVASDSWTYATIAQTYALNTLLMALALCGCVYAQRRHDRRSLILLALTVGLGIAHHSTFWLLAPAFAALFVFDAGLRNLLLGPGRPRLVAAAVTALALPLTLYAYIPLRGEQLLSELPAHVLGVPRAVAAGLLTPHYLAGWTNVVLGSFYAGSTLGGGTVDWAKGLGEYLAALHAQFHGFEILALGLLAPASGGATEYSSPCSCLAWLVNVVVVLRGVSAFNEPAGGLYTPTYLFCIVAMVLVLDSTARMLTPRLTHLRANLLSAAVLTVIVLWSLLQNFPGHDLRSAAEIGKLGFREWAVGQLSRPELCRRMP